MRRSLRVLIVEDSKDDAELLIIALEKGGYDPTYKRVDTRATMLAALEELPGWDLILADYSMPEFSAIAALNVLKERQLDLPFIIVSGTIGEDMAVAAMKAGAHDYIIKGKSARLIPAIERELREAVFRKEHREAQQRLQYLAYYDELTKLPNRAVFFEALENLIRQQNIESLFAVFLVRLDRFEIIKYSLGHVRSDRLLIAASDRLKSLEKCLEFPSLVARVGADEFAVLINNLSHPNDAQKIAQEINCKLSNPFRLDGSLICSNISIGIALSNIGYERPEKFLQAADTAMHYAKISSVKDWLFFAPEMHDRALEKLQLESDLQQAIRYDLLHLNYQPIVSLTTGKISGFEALVRWNHPQKGNISPEKFIPISEETGSIVQLGKWVLAEACARFKQWQKSFPKLIPFDISVNLSGIQLSNPDFLIQIDNLLESLELSGEYLKLEITESILMENATAVTNIFKSLKERKIKLCIDDFGTGYSSLSYLRYLPIDTLKVDRSFISNKMNKKNLNILKTIINLAHSLELDVVAEGVETKEQLLMLQSLGCEYGQGYFFSKPLEEVKAIEFIQSQF
ncbi:MAG: putative bifunctional diguanylate cyclase/phosphodiesterase [Xenococcaceae cyanobacterium]